jgi:hypothetical protein
MSITITSQPDDPAWILSPVIFKVYINDTAPFLRLRARVFIELSQRSGNFTFVAELEQQPYSKVNQVYVQDLLKEYLDINFPSLRYKVEFYEWNLEEVTLVEELYHETGGGAWVDIAAMDTTKNYLIISETESFGTRTPKGRLGTDEESAVLIGTFGEAWHKMETPSLAYDEFYLPLPYTKTYIYEIASIPIVETSDIHYCVNGSYGWLGNDNDYHLRVHGKYVNISFLALSSGSLTIDWGDGTRENVTGVTSDLSHTYKELKSYNVRFTTGKANITRCSIINDSSVVAVIYDDLSGITDNIRITGCENCSRIELTNIPAAVISLSLETNAALKYLDISGAEGFSGSLTLTNDLLLEEIIMPASGGTLSSFSAFGCAALTELDLSMFGFSGADFNLQQATLLATLSLPSPMSCTNFLVNLSALDMDFNFGTAITDCATINYADCGMSQANQDENINNIYTSRAAFAGATCTVAGTNATPSGTYDGTTDWSGGLPTSPMAKIYDLVNNITGTYNFTFTDIP